MVKNLLIFILFFSLTKSLTAQNFVLQHLDNRESLFNHGLELIALEEYDAAHIIFSKYIGLYPNEAKTIDATYYEAFCKLRMNNPQGELQIKNFVRNYPNHPKQVYANYDLGTYYFSVKDYSNAILYLKQVNLTLLDENDKLECNFKLGYSYMNIKDFDKAGAVFQRIRSTKNKYTYAANYYLGYVNYKNELYDIAEQNLKKASENASYRLLVPQLLVNIYNKQKRYDTLIAYATRTLEAIPNLKNIEEVYLYTAEAYYNKRDYTNALVYFEKFKAANGKMNDAAIYRYGYCFYKTKDYNQAILQLKSIAEQYDSTGQAAGYYLGMSWLKTDNKAFALNAFNQARKMNFLPELTAQSTLEYSKLAIELQKHTDAIEALKEYLKKYSDGKDVETANGLLGEAYLNTNDYVSALKHIESVKVKTGVLNKAYQLIAFYRGEELFNEEKYPEAIEMFEKSLLNDIDREITVLCNFWLGEALSIQKRYDEAIACYLRVYKSTNRTSKDIAAKNNYGLGYAHFNRQEYAKALPYFKDFLDMMSISERKEMVCDAALRLADCYYAIKKYNEAQNAYKRSIDYNCDQLEYAYLQRGICLALNNKEEEAKNVLNKLADMGSQGKFYYDALYNIGLIDFENTKYSASIPVFSKIIADKKSDIYTPLALQKRAVAYHNLKQHEKSAADYQAILTEYPTSKVAANALVGLNDALSRLGKHDQMDTVLQSYKAINPKDAQLEKLEFEKAKNLYYDQKYDAAIRSLEKFTAEYPLSNFTADAKYFLADAYWRNQNSKLAKETFDDIITNHKKSTYYNRSLLKFADILLEDKEYSDAAIMYNTLSQAAANPKEQANAWNGLMTAHFELKNYDSTLLYANKIISGSKATLPVINKASLFAAKAAIEEDKPTANDYLINCFNRAEDANGAEAMYLYSLRLYEDKLNKLSLEVLFDMAGRHSSQSKWIGKAFILISDNYFALGEIYQAKATLLSIVEKAGDQSLIDEAKEKLAKLESQ